MDNWLKGLVGAACCVVIAGGGYFAWTKWQGSKQAASQADYDRCMRYVDYLRRYKSGDSGENMPATQNTVEAVLESCRDRFALPTS